MDDPMDEDKPSPSHSQPPPPPPSQAPRRPSPATSPAAAPSTVATGKHPAPDGPSSSSAASVAGGPGQVPSKRRRGIGIVTPNACTECRKKRAKCDGGTPCARCAAQKGVECHYELPVRQSKETLRNELDHLRRQQRNSEQVLAALARPELGDEVVSRIRGGQSVEAISGWLEHAVPSTHSGGSGGTPSGPSGYSSTPVEGYSSVALRTVSPVSSQHQSGIRHEGGQPSTFSGAFSSRDQTTPRNGSYPEVPNWGSSHTVRGPRSRVGSWVASQGSRSTVPTYRDPDVAPGLPEMRVPPETWTSITSDGSLVQHLLSLYFCWEYPTFASLSKEHFLDDFSDGRPRFCSPILVNALLALGCRFSSRPSTRANPDNPYTAGDHFFKESQRLFYQEQDHHNLTTIQALGIMSIREASCGRDSESWYYAGQSVRLAIEMGLHRLQDDGHDDDESAVQAATFWGAFALDHAWSLATGSLPQCSCFPRLPPKPAIIDDIEASLWIPYTDDGVPLRRSYEQPSNVRSVYKCFCELSELVHQSLYILHSPGRPLTSKDLLSIYTQYLNWYDRIPEVLRLGVNFTPAVLFAHMYYHFAILLLFRPLIKLRLIGSLVTPRDVCSQAADAISSLLRSYSQLYTLRRTPSFVPYFVLTSSIMHLAIGATFSKPGPGAVDGEPTTPPVEPRVAEAIRSGIADLTEMAPCHFFAEQALNILRYLAKKWRIEVEVTPADEGGALHQGKGDFENLTRPVTSSLNFFAPNVSDPDFNCTWAEPRQSRGKQDAGEPDGEDLDQTVETLENPLFWPFPMQGRPMLPTGKELEEVGFALI